MFKFLKERKYRKSLEVNKPDFYKAMEERNFEEMSDIYNEMMRYSDLAATDGMDRYTFTEILDGYIVKLPFNALSAVRNIGKNFYYILTNDHILYDTYEYQTEYDTADIIFDYLKKENIEADKIVFISDTISLTPTAIKTLNLSVGDIIKISLDDKSFTIVKYQKPIFYK